MNVGDRVVNGSGRKGVLIAVERVWLTVQWHDAPEWPMTYHAADRWISALAAQGDTK